MSAKHAMLVAAVIAVLGLSVYLFIQVKATPVTPRATQVTSREPAPARDEQPPHEPTKPGETKTSWTQPAIPSPTPRPRVSDGVASGPTEAVDDGRKVNLKLDNLMELASKAYDAQDFDQATAIAGKVLVKDPNNVRMLRIMVSANCIQGDSVAAQQSYEKLPKPDRDQMKARCDRYGVSFKEPP